MQAGRQAGRDTDENTAARTCRQRRDSGRDTHVSSQSGTGRELLADGVTDRRAGQRADCQPAREMGSKQPGARQVLVDGNKDSHDTAGHQMDE